MVGAAYTGPSTEPLDSLLSRLSQTQGPIAIDTETVSLKDRSCIGIGIAFNEQEALYFQVLPEPSQYLSLALQLVASPILKVYHNVLFDLYVLDSICTPDALHIADTSTMAQMQALPAELAELSSRYLGWQIDAISDILPKGKNMLSLDFPIVARKCMNDCLATLRLYHKFGDWGSSSGHTWSYEPNYEWLVDPTEPTSYHVTPEMKDCYRVDMRLVPLLLRMSKRGIALRPERVSYWHERLSQEALFYRDICDREGFNPSSPQQVGMTLAMRGNILPFTKSRKQLKADEEVLLACTDPLAATVLEYRWRSKFVGTYLEPSLNSARFYTHFRMDVATGRLASFDRNIQNIPATKKRPEYPIRDIFAPDTGTWTDADASELEMRIFAHATGDPTLLKTYREKGSIHTATQEALWPGSDPQDKALRLRAKTFNFGGILYDANPKTIERNTGIPAAVCADYKARWYQRHPKTLPWMNEQKRLGLERGYQETLFGRRMRLPRLGDASVDHIEKCAINYLPQGTAADIIKRVMLRTESLNQVAQIHDEILFDGDVELPNGLDQIHPELRTPLEVVKGPNWL